MSTFTDKELIKEIKERISEVWMRERQCWERRACEIALASLEENPGGVACIQTMA
ncbi:hypothetical protein O6A27_14915 [Escherichia coli]|nr:hypothetical protein [Escherichia coli]